MTRKNLLAPRPHREENPWIGIKESQGTVTPSQQCFSRAWAAGDRGIGPKLCQERFTLDITKHFFTERIVKHWHRLHRAMVESPSLEVCKKHVDVAVEDMVLW